MRRYIAYCQHMHSAARAKRFFYCASKQEAEAQSLRELADTEWYLVDVREYEFA